MLLFRLITNLEPVMVGWGLFQNILRSVPKRQRDVGRKSPVVVPGRDGRHLHALLTLCPRRPGSEQAERTLPRAIEGRVGASSWYLGPERPPGLGHTLSQRHRPESPPRETLRAGISRGWCFVGGRWLSFFCRLNTTVFRFVFLHKCRGGRTASDALVPRTTPGSCGSGLCGCSFVGPLTNTKETTQKSNPPSQPVLGTWPSLPLLCLSSLPGGCRTNQKGLTAVSGRRQARVEGGYIPGDQPPMRAEWAGGLYPLSQFSTKGHFLCHVSERVELSHPIHISVGGAGSAAGGGPEGT